jgi:hypothetical protein
MCTVCTVAWVTALIKSTKKHCSRCVACATLAFRMHAAACARGCTTCALAQAGQWPLCFGLLHLCSNSGECGHYCRHSVSELAAATRRHADATSRDVARLAIESVLAIEALASHALLGEQMRGMRHGTKMLNDRGHGSSQVFETSEHVPVWISVRQERAEVPRSAHSPRAACEYGAARATVMHMLTPAAFPRSPLMMCLYFSSPV